jgi:YidC/Oxa1 family membrane protein insertase
MQKYIYNLMLVFLVMIFPHFGYADLKVLNVERNNINTLVENQVREQFSYSGLATFYNGLTAYIVDENSTKRLSGDNFYAFSSSQSLAIVGHYKILTVSNINATISFTDEKLIWKTSGNKEKVQAHLFLKSDLTQQSIPFQKLKYAHLWEPFRMLCVGIEGILLWLHSLQSLGWGITIILFSLIFKIFILPANILLARSQRKVSRIHARLENELEAIKANYSGEEAHNRFMTAHKEQGVTPFYNLKPLLLTLVPIPFLIVIFNVLGESDLIAGHSFLWISDLAYPDAFFNFGIHIPLLGNSINLLPILMTLLTIFAALFHQNKIVSTKELRKQKLNLYFMAFGFLLLFYPFPSAMVLYWTFTNIWGLIQQRFIHV